MAKLAKELDLDFAFCNAYPDEFEEKKISFFVGRSIFFSETGSKPKGGFSALIVITGLPHLPFFRVCYLLALSPPCRKSNNVDTDSGGVMVYFYFLFVTL